MGRGRVAPLAAVVAGASIISLAGGAAVASPPEGALPAVVAEACGPRALRAADAAETAVRCGTEVEVVAERTPWDTTFATPEGMTRVESSASAVRTDVNGVWEPIDTAVVEGEGGLRVVAPAFEMVFSDGTAGTPLARIVKDGHELTFDAPFELTDPVVDESQVTYPQVLEGVDLVVSVHDDGTGFSEVLRVGSPEAAANPALAELSFPITTSEDLSVAQADGGFEAVDGSGALVFSAPAPLMWDSAGSLAGSGSVPSESATTGFVASAPPGGEKAGPADLTRAATDENERAADPVGGDRVEAMPTTVVDDSVTVEPVQEFMRDPGTVWPVYVDPKVSGSRNSWALIRSAVPGVSEYMFSGNVGLGLCDPGTTSECNRQNDVHRPIWHFTGLPGLAAAESADVIAAQFTAFGQHSYGCTPSGVQAYAVGPVTSGTTWNNHVGTWLFPQQALSVAHSKNCGGQRPIEFDVTDGARRVADSDSSTLTIGLRAVNESSMAIGWKRYAWDTTLSVTYSRVPAAATAMTTDPATPCVIGASRPFLRTTTPTLSYRVADPDGGSVTGNLDVLDMATWSIVWDAAYDTTLPSGSTFTKAVPPGRLQNGKSYEWRAGGRDVESGRFGPMSKCQFTVDTVRPDKVPGVAPVAGQVGVYPEDAVSGGVGMDGKFQLSNGGVSDVVSYNYSFNSDGLASWKAVTVAQGGVIDFAATSAGSQRLYVQSVDRAGNTSDVRLYRFSVSFPSERAHWQFDEGTGSVASDVRGGHPAALTGGASWVSGPLADLGIQPADKALRLVGTGQFASTSGPVVNTAQDYTVMAQVKVEDMTTVRVAVSQDGQRFGAFKLGLLSQGYCQNQQPCWGFWTSADDVTGTPVMARSQMPVTPGSWVHLTGVHDAGAQTIQLYVCELGSPDNPGDGNPVLAASVPFGSSGSWTGGASVQIGRSLVDGLYREQWIGSIDDVRLYDAAVDIGEIRRACVSTPTRMTESGS